MSFYNTNDIENSSDTDLSYEQLYKDERQKRADIERLLKQKDLEIERIKNTKKDEFLEDRKFRLDLRNSTLNYSLRSSLINNMLYWVDLAINSQRQDSRDEVQRNIGLEYKPKSKNSYLTILYFIRSILIMLSLINMFMYSYRLFLFTVAFIMILWILRIVFRRRNNSLVT